MEKIKLDKNTSQKKKKLSQFIIIHLEDQISSLEK